tara:strand:- start:1126 stop:3600 length:2475 start_codon:yes stop_codon:yes gene_type:complete
MKNTITTEMMITEINWENHQIDEGVRKYRESLEGKSLEETTGGQRLIRLAIQQTIEGVKGAFEEVEASIMGSKSGGKDNWVYMISLLTAEQSSVIALNHILGYCQNPKETVTGTTQLAKKIGNTMRQQVMFENWKANEKAKKDEHNANCSEGEEFTKSYAQILIERAKGQVTRPKLARWQKKFDTYAEIEWGDDAINIGMKMIDLVCKANDDMFNYEMRNVMGKTQRLVSLTDEAWNEYEQTEEMAELQKPFLLPTLITPKPFAYVDGKVSGGYWHINSPLFSRGTNAHTSADKSAPSQQFLDAINLVQGTAWKVNPFILMVVDMLYGTGSVSGGVTQACLQTTPSMDADKYGALSKEDRAAYHAKRNVIVEEIASSRGRHSAFTRKLSIAHKMAKFSEFFFPHFADFRGRLYPMPAELTPQGDQVAKGLLQFSKGQKLGNSGLNWLKIHAANTFGMDKETLANRVKWADDNLEMLAEISSNPLTDDRWNNADEPLPFLAVAKEISEAVNMDNPEEFVSFIPVAMDGTCNGMQILSMMGRDEVGAQATNCTANVERFDLYATVASSVVEILNRDAHGCTISAEWLGRLENSPASGRKVVKRAVMTVPYGVTEKGIATQLINDKHCQDFISGSRTAVSEVMTSAILESMTKVNGKAVEIMQYFQSVSTVLSNSGTPMTWYTPMGLKVTQAYNRTSRREITTILGTVKLQVEDAEMGLDAGKQALSCAPNIIHSFDAAMLQMTVTKLSAIGIDDFAMIHDSYGVRAGQVEDLHIALRQAALDIFGGNVLADFHEYAQAQTTAQLPDIPTLGDYDVTEIINAPYFFS